MSLPQNATQFHGSPTGEERDIVIGFDLGTSCTKVVLQDPARRDAYAVPFGDLSTPGNPYLIPSKVSLKSDAYCQLVVPERGGIRGLKRSLMMNPAKTVSLKRPCQLTTNVQELISAYIALVLRHARLWFFNNLREVYGRNRIRWHLNLGIPAKNYDEGEIKRAFLDVALAGWLLSVQEDPVGITGAGQALNRVKAGEDWVGLHRDFINVVPEVAAGVAGYARSPLRQFGLHMIVDVGASTMDVATFRLNEREGEFEYYFLWAEIVDNGCFLLHRRRAGEVKKCMDDWLYELERIDDLRGAIPNTHKDYTPPPVQLADIDDRFCQEAVGCITRVVAITYTRRDPLAREWETGVPLFLCGGGSHLPLYNQRLLRRAEGGLGGYKLKGFLPMSIPKPTGLRADGLDSDQYHRLAVAYGLSFFYDDIGGVVPPSEVDDLVKTMRLKDVEFVSKDMV